MAPQNLTKTQQLFFKLNNYTAIAGLVNLWGKHFPTPTLYNKPYYVSFYIFMNFCLFVLMLLEVSAFVKWDKLSLKEISDLIVFALSHPILYWFSFSVVYHKRRAMALLRCLCVKLKHVYNDEKIEEKMTKRAKFYMAVYLSFSCLALVLYGLDSLIQVIRTDKPFTTLVVAWPDADDRRPAAALASTAYYFVWWFLILRSSTAYMLAIANTICLSHQFKTLQTYFHGLHDIFMEDDLTQREKEDKYEKALKVGIKLHSDTLWCTRQCQIVYNWVYSGQITVSLMGMAMLMLQMVKSERSTVVALAILATGSAILGTSAIFMWTAGDVTLDAAEVATAMYSSGWERCERAASMRVRRLLLVSMAQAQKSINLRGCAVVELSYQSFLSITKSSYSVFSLFY